jgi:hypothetical protein
MEKKSETWQERFNLRTCRAQEADAAIPADGLGVAVIYAPVTTGDKVYLVIESRAGSLRSQCARRLQHPKLPPAESLMVSFKADVLTDTSAEAVQTACRQQVMLAGEIRRELRPEMR